MLIQIEAKTTATKTEPTTIKSAFDNDDIGLFAKALLANHEIAKAWDISPERLRVQVAAATFAGAASDANNPNAANPEVIATNAIAYAQAFVDALVAKGWARQSPGGLQNEVLGGLAASAPGGKVASGPSPSPTGA